MADPARVLVVADRTAATPALIDAVRERAGRGSAVFTLLVPHPPTACTRWSMPEDTDAAEAETVVELAVPLLREAAGGSPVDHIVGDQCRSPRSRMRSTSAASTRSSSPRFPRACPAG